MEEIQNKLLIYCRNAFTSRDNISIKNLIRISDGWENEVFSFSMEYDEAGAKKYEDLILRIYQGNDPRQKAAREFYGMKTLYEFGYPVPRVMELSLDDSYFGKPVVIMEKINGQMMGRVFDDSPHEKRAELINLFCELFVCLHSLDWKAFVRNSLAYKGPEPYVTIDRWLELVERHINDFKADEYTPILNWLKEHRIEVPHEKPSVIHFDYHPYNIILRDDGKAYVIDWTSMEVADYRIDLAWTILLTSTYGHSEARDIVLSNYERIAGREVQQIEYFEVAASVRRLFSILLSIRDGAAKFGMRPQAVEMMKRNVNHIKNVYAFMADRTGINIPRIEAMIADLSRPV